MKLCVNSQLSAIQLLWGLLRPLDDGISHSKTHANGRNTVGQQKKIIIPLFTLDSIYSTNASGAEKMPQIIQITLNKVKNPNWPDTNQLAIYKRGRSGFELTDPASGQCGT